MPGYFTSPDGDLESIFVDDYAMIDQYAATGSLWLWGLNSDGHLGVNDITNRSSPVQTVSAGTNWKLVASGPYCSHTAAIKTDGTLWLWGLNSSGQLGDNSTTRKSSPVQTVSGGTNWKLVSAARYTTAAIKTDGTLWLWGNNNSGQLGTNNTTPYSSPVQTVSAGTNWKQLSCGPSNTVAIKTDGTLWTWGSNYNGQLGTNDTTSRSSPVQTVAAGTNWKQVASGYDYITAIKTDGTLWVWGSNQYARLGTNDLTHRSSPVQTVAGGTNWKQVASGSYHTAAIKTDGTLWTWGNNNSGQLGTNNTTPYSSPVQTVSGGTNWKQVAGGTFHTAAVKTDGTLWNWGGNSNGELGDNTTAGKSSPVQTVSAGTNWKQVAGGRFYTSAIYFYDAGNLYPSA